MANRPTRPASTLLRLAAPCLAAAALLPAPALPAVPSPPAPPGAFGTPVACARSRAIDNLLRREEWAAAEAQARAAIAGEIKTHESAFAALVAQLAIAEAGQHRDEDALWHWQVARAMGWRRGAAGYGAAGELLAKAPLRQLDEPPPGLLVRREGDGGGPFTPARKLSGADVTLPGAWRSFPRGLRVQAVVDAQGRVRQPVALDSTFSALTYAVLEAMRDWRFAPAQAAGEPVASFYELRFPDVKPFERVVDLGHSRLAEPLAALEAARYREAEKQLAKLWSGALDDAEQTRAFLGVALALRALAAAGLGREDQAICRYQAAQTLEPRLYGADLAAFGAPGALLMRHPWRAPQAECGQGLLAALLDAGGDQPTKPEPLLRRPPPFPEYARHLGIQGGLVVNSVLDQTGVLRDVVL
ncbi:MAG TPA: hypothetical protein VMW75_28135, partial [Thermoanaerobaculia bacterium]|nr:hypothetical protein [Thermoanaerobaculia bacterium]